MIGQTMTWSDWAFVAAVSATLMVVLWIALRMEP